MPSLAFEKVVQRSQTKSVVDDGLFGLTRISRL